MTPTEWVLVTSILLFALIEVVCEKTGRRRLVYLFKPLTTLLIIIFAMSRAPMQGEGYKFLIVAGLIFSMCGDIFLMLPRDRFMAGLVSFLIAHLFYIAGFLRGFLGIVGFWPLAPLGLYGVAMYRFLSPGLGKMRLPVVAYMAVIVAMGWLACAAWVRDPRTLTLFGAVGALLFIASDSILATARFRSPLPGSKGLIMATYYAAQLLIAASI
jgi:uncharacterized membrane protein YhhN